MSVADARLPRVSEFHGSATRGSDPEPSRTPPPPTRGTALRHRLAELRGPDVPAKALDARALAALAANPGCRRRAILDGAGVDKAGLASALGKLDAINRRVPSKASPATAHMFIVTPFSGAGMAKLFASEAAMEIALDAVRIHGGYGYSTEFDVERYFRDAPLMIVGEGTNEIQRNVIAGQLVARGGI